MKEKNEIIEEMERGNEERKEREAEDRRDERKGERVMWETDAENERETTKK